MASCRVCGIELSENSGRICGNCLEEIRMAKRSLVGIPLNEVGDRLKDLDESLRQNGMALKADTGVHIDCSRDNAALGFVLEVVVFDKGKDKEGKENE